jgi:hypothetical protein
MIAATEVCAGAVLQIMITDESLTRVRGRAMVRPEQSATARRPGWPISPKRVHACPSCSRRFGNVHAPPAAVAALSHPLGVVVRDVPDRRLLVSHQPALGRVSLLEWLKENASTLGRACADELDRHFLVRG